MPNTPADQNNSKLLRKYLARRPNATAMEAVRGIKAETGVDVSVALAAKVKREMATAPAEIAPAPKAKVKRRRRRRKPVEVAIASTLTIESLLAAKKLVGQLGSVEAAKTAVDALARLD